MKRRDFFASLFITPVAATGAVLANSKPPVTTAPLGELAVRVSCDSSQFDAAMARIRRQIQVVRAELEKVHSLQITVSPTADIDYAVEQISRNLR